MTRFHLFAGDYYYPSAGLGDYVNSFDSEEAAMDHVNVGQSREYPGSFSWDWWSVVIEQDGKLVQIAGSVAE